MIKIEFPADRPDIARAMGEALMRVAEEPEKEDLTEDAPKPESLFESTVEESSESPKEIKVEPTGTAPIAEPDSNTRSPSSAPVDPKGVAFDARFCGNAKEPYYTTGKRSGQWKKRKGVDDEEYDSWYAGELPSSSSELPTEPVDTAAAFGATETVPAAEPIPSTIGDFMGWVSEHQAAGRLSQADIDAAYARCGLGISSLFPPHTEAEIAANIAKLYEALSRV